MLQSQKKTIGVALLLLIGMQFLGAQSMGVSKRGDFLTLKIAVMGPGDELYFWWGHIALIIEDSATGQSSFYDWGVFSFDRDDFFVDFAFGRLFYMAAVSPSSYNYGEYIKTNRDITLYTLNLSPEKKAAIKALADDNIKPQNRTYQYHHFYNNCATRIRDILDIAVDGQFKDALGEAPGRYTLRQHVRRHTWFSPFYDWILNFWMGQDIDVPLTVWQEMFLPAEIGSRIASFSYTDEDGAAQELVSAVEVVNKAVNRPAVLDVPRKQWPRELVLGVLLAALLVFCSRLQRSSKPFVGRLLWGCTQSALGLFFGAVGFLLFFMMFFTNHDYTFHNANIIYVNPLLLAAVPAGIVYAATKSSRKRRSAALVLKSVWTYVLLGGILTMLVKLFPGFHQQNQVTQALVLPFALVLSFIPDTIPALHPQRKR
jgi:hypothetical protein